VSVGNYNRALKIIFNLLCFFFLSFLIIRLWKNNYTAHHGLVASREEKIAEEQEKDIQTLIDEVVAYEIVYTEGDIFDGAVPLGQSIGAINSIESVPSIIDEIVSTAEKLLKSAASNIK